MKKFNLLCLLMIGTIGWQHLPANNKNIWKPLFGTNLSQAEYNPEIWKETGNILSTGPEECIWTLDEYENFELDMDFRNSEGSRSSVILYCLDWYEWEPNSIKIELVDAASPLTDEFSTGICGAIYGQDIPATDGIVKDAGQWNHLRVRSSNKRLSVILNGRKVTEWDMNTLPNPPEKGYIGLEGHLGEAGIEFRNLRIRELIENENKATSPKREREPRVFPQY